MKRKAILIESSNAYGQRELPGARVDVENWNSFLKSALGGSWSSTEIKILRKPSALDVSAQLNVESDYYIFVAFSGHGEDGSVVLNDIEQSVPLNKLKPKSSRGVMIIDSCRGISSVRYNFSGRSLANLAEGSIIARNAREGRSTPLRAPQTEIEIYRAGLFRAAWEDAVKPTGIVEMLACATGQGAGEDPSAGGYYTSLLMGSAEIWNNQASTAKIHTTKNAHDFAAANLPLQQTPQYSPSWLEHPFAVKA